MIQNYLLLTSKFSKILEKVFYDRFYTFLNHFNILSNSQFGFRTNLNTTHAMFIFILKYVIALEIIKYILLYIPIGAAICIDLTK